MTRLTDLRSNMYHRGETQGSATNLVLTGAKDYCLEPAERSATVANNDPPSRTPITSADLPATLAGSLLTNTGAVGARFNTLDFRNPESGTAWLMNVTAEAAAGAGAHYSAQGGITVLDILWWQGANLTTISTSTINSPTWGSRDRNGATAGEGVGIGFLALGSLTAITDVTVAYTNSGGTGSRTATLATGVPTGSALGLVRLFELQAGDIGVQQVNSITRASVLGSANYAIFAYREICQLPMINSHGGPPAMRTGFMSGLPVKIHNGSCLCLAPITTGGLTTTVCSWRADYSYSSL